MHVHLGISTGPLALPLHRSRVALVVALLVGVACGGGTGTAPPGPAATIEVVPGAVVLEPSEVRLLEAVVRDATGREIGDAVVSWSSANAVVAAVDPSGLLQAMTMGETTVEARSGAAVGVARVEVLARSTMDRPDEIAGSVVRVLYVVPQGGVDRRLDVEGPLLATLGSIQTWLAGEIDGRRLRIDTVAGVPDVTFVRLDRTEADLSAIAQAEGRRLGDVLFEELDADGRLREGMATIVYFEGVDGLPSDHRIEPVNVDGTALVVVFLQHGGGVPLAATPTTPPGIVEIHVLHDFLHALGFVDENAPHYSATPSVFPITSHHVDDAAEDLMHFEAPRLGSTSIDVGRDDYYGSNVPAEVRNLSDSPFLTP